MLVSNKELFLIQSLENNKIEFIKEYLDYSFEVNNQKYIRKQITCINEIHDPNIYYIVENDEIYKIQEYNVQKQLIQNLVDKMKNLNIIRSNNINETILIIMGLLNRR